MQLTQAQPLRNARSENEPSLNYLPVQTVYAETVPGVESSPPTGGENIPYSDSASNAENGRPEKIVEQPKSSTCDTPGCTTAASKVMSYIDESLDPCENFYNFACGNYLKNTEGKYHSPNIKIQL